MISVRRKDSWSFFLLSLKSTLILTIRILRCIAHQLILISWKINEMNLLESEKLIKKKKKIFLLVGTKKNNLISFLITILRHAINFMKLISASLLNSGSNNLNHNIIFIESRLKNNEIGQLKAKIQQVFSLMNVDWYAVIRKHTQKHTWQSAAAILLGFIWECMPKA